MKDEDEFDTPMTRKEQIIIAIFLISVLIFNEIFFSLVLFGVIKLPIS